MTDQTPDWAQDTDTPNPNDQSVPDWASEPSMSAQAPADQGEVPDWAQGGENGSQTAPAQPQPQSDEAPSELGAFIRQGARAAPVGAVAAAGAYPSAVAGAAAGTMAAPFLGPLAPFAPPAGALLGGAAGAFGVGWIANLAEDKLFALLGLDTEGPFSEQQRAQDIQTLGGKAGELAGNLLPGFGPGAVKLGARVVGGAIQGGLEAGQELYNEGKIDPEQVALAAGAGALFAKPRGWLERTVPTRYRGGNKASEGGQNPNPDGPGPDGNGPSEPTPDFGELNVANDIETTAPGTAMVNPKTPEIPSVGNPDGAPMLAREGARPSDPGRDYRKNVNTGELDQNTENVVVNQSPVAPDMAVAMSGGGPPEQVQQPSGTADVTAPSEAAPTSPLNNPRLASARQPVSAMEAINGRVKAPQQGEIFQPRPGEEPIPGDQRPIPQTGLTPAEINHVAKARQELQRLGYTRVLDAIDQSGMSPQEQSRKLVQAYNAAQSATGEAVGRQAGELRAETPRQTVETGAVAAGKGDAARKTNAIKFVTDTYNEFGPNSEKGQAIDATKYDQAKPYVQQVWKEVLARNGGVDPLVRSQNQYVPLKQGEAHTEAYQWLRSVKQAATRRLIKNFATMHAAPGTGAETRQTGQIEGDIARRPQLPEVAEQAETAQQPGTFERPTFERVEYPKGQQNDYTDAQNAVRDWVNELSPHDYSTLADHYDVEAEMAQLDNPKHRGDPLDLLHEMQETVRQTGRRSVKPPTEEVDMPAKPAKITPTEPTGNPGRVLDRNSPEFKALAAKYSDVLPSTDRRPMLESAERQNEEGALDGSWDSFKNKSKQFLSDEKGSGKMFNPLSWMRSQPKNPMSPDADAATKEYVTSLGDRMNRFSKGAQDIRSLARAIVQMAPNIKNLDEARAAHRDAYRWLEDHPAAADDMKIKDDKVFNIVRIARRLQAEKAKIYGEIRAVDPNNEFELPPASSMNAPVEKAHVSRLRINDAAATEGPDPFTTTNRSLSSWRGSLQERDFKTLTDGKGMRVVFTPTDKGVRLWHNGRAIDRAVPPGFEGNVGDTLSVTVNKKPITMTVDNATAREASKHARGEDNTPIQFHENPLLTETNALIQAKDALDTYKLLKEVEGDKTLVDNSMVVKNADDVKEAHAKGYNQTKLAQFQKRGGYPLYINRRISEALDDFRQPGVDEDSLQGLRNVGTNLIKTLFVADPLIHGFNVGASWGVQRGFDWATPNGNKWLAKTAFDAMKAVLTQDRSVIKPAMDNGLSLLLPGTLNQRLMQSIARKAGTELMNKPPKWWDAMVYPDWNLRASDVGGAMLKYANTITWGMSDVMTLQRYLENVQRHGMSPADAVQEAHEFLPDYRVPTRVGENMLGQRGSRFVSKALREPAVSIFGAYHYDLFKQLAQMTKGVAKGNPKAAGQMMALAVGMYLMYPYLLDRGAQKVTGNSYATTGRRGPFAVAQAASDAVGLTNVVNSMIGMISGQKPQQMISPPKLATDIWTPTIPIKVGQELLNNEDFAGHPIWQAPFNKTSPKQWGRAAAHVVDWALSTALPPYQIVSSEMKKQGVKSDLLGRLAQEQVGIKNPSPAAIKYAAHGGAQWKREQKYRVKHSGPAESLFNH